MFCDFMKDYSEASLIQNKQINSQLREFILWNVFAIERLINLRMTIEIEEANAKKN